MLFGVRFAGGAPELAQTREKGSAVIYSFWEDLLVRDTVLALREALGMTYSFWEELLVRDTVLALREALGIHARIQP